MTKLNEMSKKERASTLKRRIVSIISLVFLLALFIVVAIYYGKPLLAFVANPDQFRPWVESHGIWGRLSLIGIMCLQVVIAIIPGEAVEIGAGYAFGAVEGMVLCLIGSALGSMIIYPFTKLFGVKMVEAFISKDKMNSLSFIQNNKKRNMLVFFLFFIPGTPKDIVTYFIGLTPMKLSTFLLISTLARIPSVISSTIGGNALGMKSYIFAVLVFIITAVISLAGMFVYNRISKYHAVKKLHRS